VAESRTLFEAIGGSEAFESLVERFYASVAGDPVLRTLYPEDLEAPRRHLTLFLIQYFGGPATYSEERGHPRLRIRHLLFAIDREARDRWVVHMLAALEALELPEAERGEMRKYFEDSATFMINRPG
jgi:hemoglobin